MILHNKIIPYILVFLFSFISIAQDIKIDGSFILFREAKTKQPVLIVNDSTLYKGFKPIKKPFKYTKYPAILQEYIPFNVGDKTYLVHAGCGPVLEFRNDSIVSINDAYLQNNQYDAIHFVYKNEIYFFGGYGLFTSKNILTKYNFKTKDWIEVQTRGEQAQEPRALAYGYKKGNDLYVFGGICKDLDNVSNGRPLDNKVWRLHLPTMQWECVGTYDQNIINIKSEIKNLDSDKLYFCYGKFLEIDHLNNKVNTYKCNYFPSVLTSYQEGDMVVGVYSNGFNKKFFHVGPITDFKGELLSTSVFVSPLLGVTELGSILVFLLILSLLLYRFRNKLKEIIRPFNGIIYNQKKKAYYFKGNPILLFDDQEKKLLTYLLEHLNQFISLNELNQLFENRLETETYWATVKRREQIVNSFLNKVSKITGIGENELLIDRKNALDKRLKDVWLLPNLLKRE